jgi:hypothetical protein
MTTIAEQLAETRKRSRFIASHFRRGREEGEYARITIPADPHRDDDLRLDAYIEQQRSAAASTQALREAAELVLDLVDWDGIGSDEWRNAISALRTALAALEPKP